jgi:hypothetical protein
MIPLPLAGAEGPIAAATGGEEMNQGYGLTPPLARRPGGRGSYFRLSSM